MTDEQLRKKAEEWADNARRRCGFDNRTFGDLVTGYIAGYKAGQEDICASVNVPGNVMRVEEYLRPSDNELLARFMCAAMSATSDWGLGVPESISRCAKDLLTEYKKAISHD
jgi:hypothetical protein